MRKIKNQLVVIIPSVGRYPKSLVENWRLTVDRVVDIFVKYKGSEEQKRNI